MPRVQVQAVHVALLSSLAIVSSPLSAQESPSIVGMVQDASGAILPGVTVEASSEALIEGTRSAVTDGSGRYTIVNLRPGTYVVTFSLEGFKGVRRENILLQGAFAATVNASLEVGALQETITVSGASPVVDLQSTQNQFVTNREVLDVLPATRSMQGGASLVPGVSFYSQGFVSTMSVHGSSTADQRIYQDGMRIGQNLTGTGSQANGTGVNDLAQEELVFDAGGQSAETPLGGVRMDSIPKEGGNRFSGAVRYFYSNGSLQNNNVSDAMLQFIRFAQVLDVTSNFNSTFGGPIAKSRLWFFAAFRSVKSDTFAAGVSWPNGDRVNRGVGPAPHGTFRLTGQLNSNNKLRGAYYNSNSTTQRFDVGCSATSGNRVSCVSPEASYDLPVPMSQSADLRWTSTVTSRLLLEVTGSWAVATYRFGYQPENGPFAIENRDDTTGWRTVASSVASADYLSNVWDTQANATYVTGAHNIKFGLQHQWGNSRNFLDNRAGMSVLRFLNGVPNSVTVRNTPTLRLDDLNADTGMFVQDRWTHKRLTLFGGGRFDLFDASYPDQTAVANPFVPARSIQGATCQPCWKDWSVRGGGSFDLFGNQKTALKTSFGKFLAANALGLTTSLNPLGAQSDTRTWRDLDGNGTAVNADGSPQWAEIGPSNNNAFGLPAGSLRIHPDLPRSNNWEETVSLQHELFKNVSITGGYYRRQFYKQQVTINRAVDPAVDFTPFTFIGPSHPNLPNGGGETITVYNLNDNKRGSVDSIRTWSDANTRVYNGFEVSVNGRFGRGFAFGGITTERTAVDNCTDLTNSNPNFIRFCKQTPPFRTLYKASGSYRLPWDLQVGGTFQARPGIPIGSALTLNAAVAGRPLTGGVASIAVELVDPTKLFYSYVYTNDVQFSRTFRFQGNRRIRTFVEAFNFLNNSTIFTRNETWGAQWYNPISLVDARRFQFGAQLDF
ncbi:MAG: TonB-dependent receptor [Acidimicrobiia bacterium]|nr:TonB-dependent receptor [Acidimicrobiia bacterium]